MMSASATAIKAQNGDAQKKRSSHKAVESVRRPGRESVVGKIFERGTSRAVSERGGYGG